jgi:TetR/AcrR family transcriptional regulator
MGIIERKEREKEQRRSDILDAAEKVFFKKGFEQATMDDVATQAELSKGTIYLYFKSKEELYIAIGMRAHRELRHMFEKAVNPDKTVIDNILEVGKAFVRFSGERSDYFKTLVYFEAEFDLQHVHGEYEKLCQNEEDPMSFFIKLLQQGIDSGLIRTDMSAVQLAHILWTQTTGILKLASTKDFHTDLQDVSEEEIIMNHFEIIKYGLLNKK